MHQGKPFMEPPQTSSSFYPLYHQQPQIILRQPRPNMPVIFQQEQPPPQQLEWRPPPPPPPPPLPFPNVQINPTIHQYPNPNPSSKEPFWANNIHNLENIKIQENLARSNGPELTEFEAMYNAAENSSPPEASEAKRRRKRRRKKKMEEKLSSMAVFFEALMKQAMDHQDFLHRKFLEVIERMDRERMDREIEWRRKEAEKDEREAEEREQERASAWSREALITAYIQKITGNAVNFPTPNREDRDAIDRNGAEV